MKYYNTGGNVGNLTAEESSLSSWAGPYVTEMLGRGAALASQMPYQPYTGPLTAGPSALQQQAYGGLGALSVPSTLTGAGMGYGGLGSFPAYQPMTPQPLEPMAGQDIPYYMRDSFDPELGASMRESLGELERQYEQALTDKFGDYRGENQFTQLSLGPTDLPIRGTQPASTTYDEQGQLLTQRLSDLLSIPIDPNRERRVDPMFAGPRGPDDRPLGAEMPAGITQQLITQQGAPTTQQQIASLMNPYIEQALNPQLQAAQRQADIAAQNLQSQYGKAGAYGGSRQGIAEAELQRGLLDRMAQLTGQGYSTAYDKAVDLLGKERGYGLDVLREQRQAGAEQRAIEQAGIAADIAQFEQERDYPYKQVQFMQSLLQGLPLETQSYSYYQPTGLQNLLGGLSDVTGIYDLLGEYLQPSGSDSGTTQAGQQYMTKEEIEALTGVKLP